jgi:hypothetical protein
MSTVATPQDVEDVLHCGETADTPVTTVLLSLVFLHGDAAVILLEYIALLQGVVDRGFVVWA